MTAAIATPKADIRADSNRDGIVDIVGDSDIASKMKWTETTGALFLPNIGDTDRRCSKLALAGPALSNEELDDCNDASDTIQRAPHLMASIMTVPIPRLVDKAFGTISILDKTARENVRIFRSKGDEWIYTDNEYKFSQTDLKAGLKLGIDARDTRRPGGWDGKVTVTFTVRGNDGFTSTDEVMLRVAPVLTHHHLQDVEEVLALKGNKTKFPALLQFTKDLDKAVKEADVDEDILLFEHTDDIWVQDFSEPGYASIPGPDGAVSIRIMIRSPQDERVAGRLLFEYYRKAGVGAVQHLGGARDEINSGGNIETVPPYSLQGKTWPAGRVILGNWTEKTHHILPYLQAQETQDPILLDTHWLLIGHVDEFIQFIPANVERGWVPVVNDPRVGIEMLKKLQDQGHGSINAYSRKNITKEKSPDCNSWACDPIPVPDTTVDQMLANKHLMDTNLRCAKSIDANIDILKKEVGLQDEDFIHLPGLYHVPNIKPENLPAGLPFPIPNRPEDKDRVMALFPASINNLVLTGYETSIAPNPWGPSLNGIDVMAEDIKSKFEEVGWDVEYIDDWDSHHNYGGEVHCGSNSIRDMSAPWW